MKLKFLTSLVSRVHPITEAASCYDRVDMALDLKSHWYSRVIEKISRSEKNFISVNNVNQVIQLKIFVLNTSYCKKEHISTHLTTKPTEHKISIPFCRIFTSWQAFQCQLRWAAAYCTRVETTWDLPA